MEREGVGGSSVVRSGQGPPCLGFCLTYIIYLELGQRLAHLVLRPAEQQADRQTGREGDRQAERQKDRQTDR